MTWAVTPNQLFCIPTSNCRVLAEEMTATVNHEEYYSMGFEYMKIGGQWAYGHSGYSNSFMFYIEKTGVTITGTINDLQDAEPDPMRWWNLVNGLVTTCLEDQLQANPPKIDCPGTERPNAYMKMGSTDFGGSCERACEAWSWADGWSTSTCEQKCKADGNWDDSYVTCLQRQMHCNQKKSVISQNKCEAEPPGCFAECSSSNEDWWKCIPRCEGR